MTFVLNKSRGEYIAEQMERWRQYAQCQCAAHAMKAMERAVAHWDLMKKLEEWRKTPEGKKHTKEMRKMVKALTQERRSE